MRFDRQLLLSSALVVLTGWKMASGADDHAPATDILPTFEVKEEFGLSQPVQILDFDLSGKFDRSSVHVTNGDGKPVVFQFLEDARKVAVLTDLPAGQTRRWQFRSGL